MMLAGVVVVVGAKMVIGLVVEVWWCGLWDEGCCLVGRGQAGIATCWPCLLIGHHSLCVRHQVTGPLVMVLVNVSVMVRLEWGVACCG